VTNPGLVGFLYIAHLKEWRLRKNGHRVEVTKAPKYANIDYVDFYGEKSNKEFRTSRDRSALRANGTTAAGRHRRQAAEVVG